MIGLIILLVWLFGWIFSIYPIYESLTRTHQENLYSKHSHNPLTRKDIAAGLASATGLGLIWFVVIPTYLSYVIHKRRRPRLSEEADRQIDSYKNELDHKEALREALAQAKAELEKKSRSDRDSHRDYDTHWPPKRR